MKKMFTTIFVLALGCASFAQGPIRTKSENQISISKDQLSLPKNLSSSRAASCLGFGEYTLNRASGFDLPWESPTGDGIGVTYPFNGVGYINAVGVYGIVDLVTLSATNVELTISIHSLDVDGFPGALLYTQDVLFDDNPDFIGAWLLTTPVMVNGDFMITIINNDAQDMNFFSSDEGDGQSEALSFDLWDGDWFNMFDDYGADIEWATFIIIEHELAAGFDAPATATTGEVINFINTSVIDDLGYVNEYVSVYTWDFGDGTTSTNKNPSHSYTTCGVYDVTLTIAVEDVYEDECTDEITTTITVTSDNTLDFTATDASACGVADGEIEISLGTANEEFSFEISGTPYASTASEITVDNLAAGSYTFVVTTDDTNCDFNVAVVISETGAAVISVTSTELACNGDDDAELTVTSADDISGYTFTWSTTETGTQITVGAGTYTVTGTDGACNVSSPSIIVSQPTQITVGGVVSGTDINVVAAGGTGALTFSWEGPSGFTASTQNIVVSANGTYTVTVTDENGCSVSEDFMVSTVGLAVTNVKNINVYPNPANNEINFDLAGTNASKVNVFDASGQLIALLNVENEFTSMTVHRLADGLYFYHITSNDGTLISVNKFAVVK